MITIDKGKPVANGPIAIIAPGTDLGEWFMTWNGSEYIAHTSEGGHSDFVPNNQPQICLLHYLLPGFRHVGVEHVCSGIGILNIYKFLRDEENILERPEIAQLIASAKDHSKAIVEAAFHPLYPSELCRATVDLLVSILAGEAGKLALKVLATCGGYLAGGIALRVLTLSPAPHFVETRSRKGRFKDLMERMPIHIITIPAALPGAATFGRA
jgi:glucokinase